MTDFYSNLLDSYMNIIHYRITGSIIQEKGGYSLSSDQSGTVQGKQLLEYYRIITSQKQKFKELVKKYKGEELKKHGAALLVELMEKIRKVILYDYDIYPVPEWSPWDPLDDLIMRKNNHAERDRSGLPKELRDLYNAYDAPGHPIAPAVGIAVGVAAAAGIAAAPGPPAALAAPDPPAALPGDSGLGLGFLPISQAEQDRQATAAAAAAEAEEDLRVAEREKRADAVAKRLAAVAAVTAAAAADAAAAKAEQDRIASTAEQDRIAAAAKAERKKKYTQEMKAAKHTHLNLMLNKAGPAPVTVTQVGRFYLLKGPLLSEFYDIERNVDESQDMIMREYLTLLKENPNFRQKDDTNIPNELFNFRIGKSRAIKFKRFSAVRKLIEADDRVAYLESLNVLGDNDSHWVADDENLDSNISSSSSSPSGPFEPVEPVEPFELSSRLLANPEQMQKPSPYQQESKENPEDRGSRAVELGKLQLTKYQEKIEVFIGQLNTRLLDINKHYNTIYSMNLDTAMRASINYQKNEKRKELEKKLAKWTAKIAEVSNAKDNLNIDNLQDTIAKFTQKHGGSKYTIIPYISMVVGKRYHWLSPGQVIEFDQKLANDIIEDYNKNNKNKEMHKGLSMDLYFRVLELLPGNKVRRFFTTKQGLGFYSASGNVTDLKEKSYEEAEGVLGGDDGGDDGGKMGPITDYSLKTLVMPSAKSLMNSYMLVALYHCERYPHLRAVKDQYTKTLKQLNDSQKKYDKNEDEFELYQGDIKKEYFKNVIGARFESFHKMVVPALSRKYFLINNNMPFPDAEVRSLASKRGGASWNPAEESHQPNTTFNYWYNDTPSIATFRVTDPVVRNFMAGSSESSCVIS